jgi:acyl-[acyl carrier protein]--UDP-N-acetylglucosamine O-acyltransferase
MGVSMFVFASTTGSDDEWKYAAAVWMDNPPYTFYNGNKANITGICTVGVGF